MTPRIDDIDLQRATLGALKKKKYILAHPPPVKGGGRRGAEGTDEVNNRGSGVVGW